MNITKSIKLAILTALVSGISIFINKFAVGAISSPLAFTAIKNTAVALLVIAGLISLRKFKTFANLNSTQWLQLTAIGLIGGALPFYLFFTGLSQTSAINSAIIHKSLIIWVAILAYPFLKEKLSPLQILAVIMLFASNLIIGGFKSFTWSTGELMILSATILWSVENIIAKKVLKTLDPDLVVAARMGIGSAVLLIATVITTPQSLSQVFSLNLTQTLWITATVITLLAYNMTWYRALKHAPASLVTSVLVSSTIVTNILSAIFITHTWNTAMGIQATVIALGIYVFVYQNKHFTKYFPYQHLFNKITTYKIYD